MEPLGHMFRAEPLIEFLRVYVPVEDDPFHTPAAEIAGVVEEMLNQAWPTPMRRRSGSTKSSI